jgi:hypothetical protein
LEAPVPLYLDTNTYSENIMSDLILIVRCDDDFGDDPTQGTPPNDPIFYTQTTSGPGQDLVQALVNGSASIIIGAVDPSFQLAGGVNAGQYIVDVGGVDAYVDGSDIRVFYDPSDGGGLGYVVHGYGGVPISSVGTVRLFRGLAYASRIALSQSTAGADIGTDENFFRLQVLMTERDENDPFLGHGPGNGESPQSCGGCFVVTAAFGADEARRQVDGLRALRDKIAGRSLLCGDFLRRLMEEYRRFSPAIAAEMRARPALQRAMRNCFVTPLLQYRRIFALYAANATALDRLAGCLRGDDLFAALDPACVARAPAIAAAANALVRRLKTSARVLSPSPPVPPTDTENPGRLFTFVGDAIEAGAGPVEHIGWALRALALFWTAVAGACDDAAIGRAIEDWLAEVPLPEAIGTLPGKNVAEDLASIRFLIFRSPSMRGRLARRLGEAGVAKDLLLSADFVAVE